MRPLRGVAACALVRFAVCAASLRFRRVAAHLRRIARPVLAFARSSPCYAVNNCPCAANTPRDTPARGFGRASFVVGQWVFSSLLSHSRRYAIRRVRRLASLVVCRRVVLVLPRRGEKDAGGSSLSLRGAIFAHDPSGFRKAKATFGRSILPPLRGNATRLVA